jgi:hypothetical protein
MQIASRVAATEGVLPDRSGDLSRRQRSAGPYETSWRASEAGALKEQQEDVNLTLD